MRSEEEIREQVERYKKMWNQTKKEYPTMTSQLSYLNGSIHALRWVIEEISNIAEPNQMNVYCMLCGMKCSEMKEDDWIRWREEDEHFHPILCDECEKKWPET